MPHEHAGGGLAREPVLELCLDEFLTELPSEPNSSERLVSETAHSVAAPRSATGSASAAESAPRSTRVRELRPPPPSSRRPPPPRTLVREGDVIGAKYSVQRVLGHNGHEIVVRAQHVDLGSPVVIRIMTAEAVLVPGAVERFRSAAQRALRLQSDQAERVLDLGRLADGTPYRVAALPRGPSLTEVLHVRQTLPTSEAVDLVLSLTEAVAEAHTAGIVFGNLSTENLFVERKPDHPARLCFVDFGVVQSGSPSLRPGNELALPGVCSMIQALPYLAPEQFRTPANVDHRADLWALGALLFEMLSGRPAFRGDSDAELRSKIISAELPELCGVRRDVPRALAAAVHACLQVEPWLRPQSVLDLDTMLLPFSSRRPPRAHERARVETVTQEVNTQSAPITLVGHPAPVTVTASPAEASAVVVHTTHRPVYPSLRHELSLLTPSRPLRGSASLVSARTPTFYSLLCPPQASTRSTYPRIIVDAEEYMSQVSERAAPSLQQDEGDARSAHEPASAPAPMRRRSVLGRASVLLPAAAATIAVSVLAAVGTSRLLERPIAPPPLPRPVVQATLAGSEPESPHASSVLGGLQPGAIGLVRNKAEAARDTAPQFGAVPGLGAVGAQRRADDTATVQPMAVQYPIESQRPSEASREPEAQPQDVASQRGSGAAQMRAQAHRASALFGSID